MKKITTIHPAQSNLPIELRRLQVAVYCRVSTEQENIWLSRQNIQVLLTAYCALAQAESEDMSESIRWGIKRGFQNGTSGYLRQFR